MTVRFLIVVLAACVLVVGSRVEAADSGSIAASIAVDIRFTSDEVRVIRAYYENHQREGKGRGKGKSQGLPPGIAKNLARGKPLPPGIAKQYLPDDLLRKLPPAADGYERLIIDGKILLVEAATQIVRDVLTDIMFGD